MKETESIKFYEGKLIIDHTIDSLKQIIKVSLNITAKHRPLLCVLLMQPINLMLIFVIFWMWGVALQANFGSGRMSWVWYLIVSLSFLGSLLGAKMLEWLNWRNGARYNRKIPNSVLQSWTTLVSLFASTAILGLGISKTMNAMTIWVFVAAIFIVNFGYGFLTPAYISLLNRYIPDQIKERATINSLGTMLLHLFMVILLIPIHETSSEMVIIRWMIPAIIVAISTIGLSTLLRRYSAKANEQFSEPIFQDVKVQTLSLK